MVGRGDEEERSWVGGGRRDAGWHTWRCWAWLERRPAQAQHLFAHDQPRALTSALASLSPDCLIGTRAEGTAVSGQLLDPEALTAPLSHTHAGKMPAKMLAGAVAATNS